MITEWSPKHKEWRMLADIPELKVKLGIYQCNCVNITLTNKKILMVI